MEKKKQNQAWLKTVGKVVTLIFLFLPSSQNQGRKAAQYHKDPDEAHQHFWKACARVWALEEIVDDAWRPVGESMQQPSGLWAAWGRGSLRRAVCAKLLQSCPTRCYPMDCSPPRLFCSWDSLGKNAGVGCHALLQEILQGSNPHLLHLRHWQVVLYHEHHLGNPERGLASPNVTVGKRTENSCFAILVSVLEYA